MARPAELTPEENARLRQRAKELRALAGGHRNLAELLELTEPGLSSFLTGRSGASRALRDRIEALVIGADADSGDRRAQIAQSQRLVTQAVVSMERYLVGLESSIEVPLLSMLAARRAVLAWQLDLHVSEASGSVAVHPDESWAWDFFVAHLPKGMAERIKNAPLARSMSDPLTESDQGRNDE